VEEYVYTYACKEYVYIYAYLSHIIDGTIRIHPISILVREAEGPTLTPDQLSTFHLCH